MIDDLDERAALTTRQMRLTAVIVASALFMQNLDSTIVATALPAMARSFHADPLHMSLALTSYLLSLAVFFRPRAGWPIGSAAARCFASPFWCSPSARFYAACRTAWPS